MTWTLTTDVEDFLAAAGDLLRAQRAENTIVLTAVEQIRVGGTPPGDVPPVFGYWTGDTGQVGAIFAHTPPFGVALSATTPAAATDLAAELADAGRIPPGVHAPPEAGTAFADAWCARTGRRYRLTRSSRLHRLQELRPPDPTPPGTPRLGTADDRDLLVAWMHAFHAEATVGSVDDPSAMVDSRLGWNGFTVWEHDGLAVSMAGANRAVAGHARVGPVYTPPEHRRRGFGGAVTAARTQTLLDAGVDEVVLFTDLANPTSNALYRRLGYVPLSDRVELAFDV